MVKIYKKFNFKLILFIRSCYFNNNIMYKIYVFDKYVEVSLINVSQQVLIEFFDW